MALGDVALSFIICACSFVAAAGLFTLYMVTRKKVGSNVGKAIYTFSIAMLILGLVAGGGLYPIWLYISPNSNAAFWKGFMAFIFVPPVLILTAIFVWKHVGSQMELFAAEAIDLRSMASYLSVQPTYIDSRNIRRVSPVQMEEWMGKRRDPAIVVDSNTIPYDQIIKFGITIPAGSIIKLKVHPIYSILNLRKRTELSVDATRLSRRMFGDMVGEFEEDRNIQDDMLYIPDQLFKLEPKAAMQEYSSRLHTCSKCDKTFDVIKCPACEQNIPPPPLIGISSMREVAQDTTKNLSKQITINTRFEMEFDVRLKKTAHNLATLFAKIRDRILAVDKSLTTEVASIDSEIDSILSELNTAQSVYPGTRSVSPGFDAAMDDGDLDE